MSAVDEYIIHEWAKKRKTCEKENQLLSPGKAKKLKKSHIFIHNILYPTQDGWMDEWMDWNIQQDPNSRVPMKLFALLERVKAAPAVCL